MVLDCDFKLITIYIQVTCFNSVIGETRRHGQRLRAKEGEIGRGGGWKERNDKEDKRVSWPVTKKAAFVFAAVLLVFDGGMELLQGCDQQQLLFHILKGFLFENGRGWGFLVDIMYS